MGSIIRLSEDRINSILEYCNENGEPKTCKQFKINIETLHRYQRERKWRDTKQPKILLLDIETARMHVGVWRLGKQRVGPDNVIKDWFMLGWGAKWLFNSETQSDFVTGKEALKRDDKRICKSLWKLVNDSDIIITHNGIQFDVPKINTRFILNGLTPPAPYLMIDTKKIAYKQFGFSSNALNYLGKIMLSKEKIHTDYQLWIDCEEGKQESIDFMETYCKGDVGLLEEVYLELRPWIKSHPNLAIMMDAKDPCCPNCGSFSLTEENHYYTTPQNKYKVVRCNSCGAVNRRAISDLDLTPAQRKSRIVPSSR